MVLLIHWSALQWAPPPSKQWSVSDCWWSCSPIGQHCSGPLPQASNCQWRSDGRQAEREVRGGSWPSPRALQLTPPQACRWAGQLREQNRLGAVSWRTPEPSPGPPSGQAQALRQQRWTFPPIPASVTRPNSNGCPPGCHLRDLAPSIWESWGAWGSVGSWAPDSFILIYLSNHVPSAHWLSSGLYWWGE